MSWLLLCPRVIVRLLLGLSLGNRLRKKALSLTRIKIYNWISWNGIFVILFLFDFNFQLITIPIVIFRNFLFSNISTIRKFLATCLWLSFNHIVVKIKVKRLRSIILFLFGLFSLWLVNLLIIAFSFKISDPIFQLNIIAV